MHFPTLLLTLSTLSLAILATPVPSSPLSADLIARDPTPQSGPSDFTDCYDDEHCRETGDEAHRRLRTKPNGDGNRLGTKRQAEGSDIAEWEGLSSGSGDYTKRKKRQAEGSEIAEWKGLDGPGDCTS